MLPRKNLLILNRNEILPKVVQNDWSDHHLTLRSYLSNPNVWPQYMIHVHSTTPKNALIQHAHWLTAALTAAKHMLLWHAAVYKHAASWPSLCCDRGSHNQRHVESSQTLITTGRMRLAKKQPAAGCTTLETHCLLLHCFCWQQRQQQAERAGELPAAASSRQQCGLPLLPLEAGKCYIAKWTVCQKVARSVTLSISHRQTHITASPW